MALETVSKYTITLLVLDHQRTVQLEAGTTDMTVSITSHGLNTGDMVVNTTRRAETQLLSERGSRKITKIDSNTFTVYPAITGQTQNDNMHLFKFVDKTGYLLDGTLTLTLRAAGKNEATFDIDIG